MCVYTRAQYTTKVISGMMVVTLAVNVSINRLECTDVAKSKYSLPTAPHPTTEMSRRMGKATICIGENKGTDQLPRKCEADQRLCFHSMDSTIPFPFKSKISTCADPEIFTRGGPTKMVIFCHRRGGVQPPKNPEITFF